METTSKKGFTIIELMIVISIIAILASIVAPKMNQTKLSFTLSNDIREIQGALNKARLEALKTGEFTSVNFTPNAGGAAAYTSFVDTNRDGIHDTGETVLQSGRLHDISIMATPSFTNNLNGGFSTQFNQMGFPFGLVGGVITDYSGTIDISGSINPTTVIYQRLTISTSGQTTIAKQTTPFP